MILITFITSSLLIFGCKKSQEAPLLQEHDLYNVSFTVSNISIKTDATTIAADSIKNFEYYIYTVEGSRVRTTDKKITTTASSVEIKEKLAPGKYKFVFFSADKPFDRHISDKPGEVPGFLYANIFNVYHKTVDIAVSTDNIKQAITLDKLNSSLEFDLLDQSIPENVASILLSWNDNKYVDFYGESFTSGRKQKSLSFNKEEKNRKIEKFSTSVFNTSAPFTVYISYLDTNGRHISGKEIKNIRCYKNQKTVLSGYLFNPEKMEFQATVNEVTEELISTAL